MKTTRYMCLSCPDCFTNSLTTAKAHHKPGHKVYDCDFDRVIA